VTAVIQPSDPQYLKVAIRQLGLSEIQGPAHEKRVVAMYAASGHPEVKDDETAWCAAFVGWCLKQAGLSNTGNLMARSYVRYGRGLDINKPAPRGAIAVWPRGKPPSGHVNFVLNDDGTYLTCIGGNQGNGRGGGVTVTKDRKANVIALRMPILAHAKPAPVPPPPDVEPPPQPDPAPSEPELPWWHPKRIINWIVATFAGGLTIGGVTLDAEFLKAFGWIAGVAFVAFVFWVYALPPRGKFWKGIFK
jgi:uncharacterized protein (TIGR02594 family)